MLKRVKIYSLIIQIMKPLEEPRWLTQWTLIGNPLFSPDANLIWAIKKRKSLFSIRREVHLIKSDFEIWQFQSAVWTSSIYDFFDESNDYSAAVIWKGFRNAVIRLLPKDNSFEEEINFIDGVGVMDEALDAWFVERVYFSTAVMRIIDIIVDYTSESSEAFDAIMSEQLEIMWNKIEDLNLSEKEVLQVTKQWAWKVCAYPKWYFDDTWTPGEERKFSFKLPNFAWNNGNGWLVTW